MVILLNLDLNDLEARFYDLSKQWHPDRFARGTPDEKRTSEIATATLNDGYRTLKDSVARAEYVLKEHGLEGGGQRSNTVPPELLDEVFELNSAQGATLVLVTHDADLAARCARVLTLEGGKLHG